jgi:hypothetical protein
MRENSTDRPRPKINNTLSLRVLTTFWSLKINDISDESGKVKTSIFQ